MQRICFVHHYTYNIRSQDLITIKHEGVCATVQCFNKLKFSVMLFNYNFSDFASNANSTWHQE